MDTEALRNHPSVLDDQSITYPIQEFLQKAWNLALGLDVDVDVDGCDNFTACGGDSFTAVYLLNNITKYVRVKNPNGSMNVESLLECILTGKYESLKAKVNSMLDHDNKDDHKRMNNNTPYMIAQNGSTLNPNPPNNNNNNNNNNMSRQQCSHYRTYQKQCTTTTCGCHPRPMNNQILPLSTRPTTITKTWQRSLGKCNLILIPF